MKKILLSFFTITAGIFIHAQINPTIFYVDEDATGAETGFTWTDAFIELYEAIDSANNVSSGPVEIWIAEGTYKPFNQTSPFNLTRPIKIFGGFDGTETALSQRDPKINLTIIDGDLNGNDSGTVNNVEPTRQDNAFCLFRLSSSDCQLDGLILQGAHGIDFSQRWFYDGSAVYIGDGSINSVVSNCIIRNNSAQNNIIYHRAGRDFGGGSRGAGNFAYNEIANNFSSQSIMQFEVHSSATGAQIPDHTTVFRNNLVHSNTIVPSVIGELTSLMYLRAFSQNSGTSFFVSSGARHFLEISHNTFVNNDIPTNNGHIIRHRLTDDQPGGVFPTQIMSITDNIFAENNAVNVMYWDSVAQTKQNTQAIFARNIVEDSDTVRNADLNSFNPTIAANFYEVNSGFTDAANDDYTIIGCDKPGVDLGGAPVLTQTLEAVDFYGNPRVAGTSADIGHAEVQDEFNGLSVEQVGLDLVANPGLDPYTWVNITDPQNPIFLTDTTNTITPTTDGTYAVLVEGPNGCADREDVNFCGAVQVELNVVGDSIVATGTGGDTYTLRFEGNIISGYSSTPQNAAPFQGYGKYQVSHFIGGGGSCTATDVLQFCGDIPTVSITQNGTELEASVVDAANYQWFLDGNAISGANSSIINLTNSPDGDYYVEVNENSCSGVSNTISYCGSIPTPPSIGTNGDSLLVAPGGFDTYQWALDGAEIAGATNQNFAPTQSGDYTVTVGFINGCNSTSSIYSFLISSINESNTFSINIYPNPADNYIFINSGNEQVSTIKLFDLTGKIVIKIDSEVSKIDVSSLQKGIYFLELSNSEKRSVVKVSIQ